MSEENSNKDILPDGFIISNRYQVERVLGKGGMGVVYLANDTVLQGSQVAVKVLHPSLCQEADLAQRFLREVQLMNLVNNPNVVRTFDVGRDKNIVYFTMEYLKGHPLDRLIVGKQLPITTVCKLGIQITSALEAIHAAEIIHRDLKPANILVLEDLSIKLTDFGVARPKNSELTQHKEIIGSVHYMAPEIWLGKDICPAVDFYSLGVVLYQMLTGELPFHADEPANLMWMHVKRPPTPPKRAREDIPNWLNSFVLKLLAKSAKDRPNSSSEIMSYLSSNALRLSSVSDGNAFATGTFSALSTGSFPQTTQSALSGKKATPRRNSRKKKLTTLLYCGIGVCLATYLSMPWLISWIEDFFPL